MDKYVIGGKSEQVKYQVKGERKADYTILVNMPGFMLLLLLLLLMLIYDP